MELLFVKRIPEFQYSVLSIKQLQAFYWFCRLGSQREAAEKLHVTQSAVTKRLQEMEAMAAAPLFQVHGKKTVLTQIGNEFLAECERMLALLHELETLKQPEQPRERTLHLGLTELTALTWFSAFLDRMKEIHPEITVQPHLDLSVPLQQKVEKGKLDIAIVAEPRAVEGLTCVPLATARFGWLAAPRTFPESHTCALADLAKHALIEQSAGSIVTALSARLLDDTCLQPVRIHGGDNIVALAALVSAGIGISCLPVALFEKEIRLGQLQLVKTRPSVPRVVYSCIFLQSPDTTLELSVSAIAGRCAGESFRSNGSPPSRIS